MATQSAAQRLVARTVLSLPTPVLRLLSGGGVVYKAGRTLDPRLQFVAAQARRQQPPMDLGSPQEARRAEAALVAAMSAEPPAGVRWQSLVIPGPAGDMLARLYRSTEVHDSGAPLMVWAHMGGGVVGSLDTSHAFCGLLAEETGGPVLSVDYRLAPEHRFPAGLEDVLAAYRWALENVGRWGAKSVAIGGDSMGGAFAAAICQILRDAGEPQPALQLLVFPAVDVASDTGSMTVFADAFPLTRALMEWFIGHYLGPDADPADPRLSPLRARSLKGLAPAVIATAGFDPLVDQGEAYAKALKDAGVSCAYRRYDSLCHAFTAFTGAAPAAEAACREIAAMVREAFRERV